jgi:hypothetical protein
MANSYDLVAGTVMNAAAASLNDVARTVYTYTAQVPHLNTALQELQEEFELNDIPVTAATSAVINCPSGTTVIEFNVAPDPELPADLIEPQKLWERTEGIDPWIPMTKVDALPLYMEGAETNAFIFWVWESQKIKLLATNQDNDIKMEYTRNLFTPVVDENSPIGVINAQTFLQYRTAALCAEFIGENKTRADDLNAFAALAIGRATGIGTKGRQAIVTRRRPFRASYKRRTFQ